MGYAQNTMETGFKRKRKVPQFYGYDPSIQTLPGDPRLVPPPSWFGVNFHPSQPVNNAWRDWAGEEYPLFDISKNKAVPLSNEAAVVKHSHQRKKKKELMVMVPRRLMSMVLHSPQPVHNSWSDWKDGYTHKITLPNHKIGIRLQAIQSRSSHHHCCADDSLVAESTRSGQQPMDLERESKVRTLPMPDLSQIPSSALSQVKVSPVQTAPQSSMATTPAVYSNVRKPAVANSPAAIPVGAKKSGVIVYKDRAQRRAAADKRNKSLQLILRIKKQLYVTALEERVAHLEEQQRRICVRAESSDPSIVRDIDWALTGNATFDVASHRSCSHAKTDPWQIIQSKLDGRKQNSQSMEMPRESPEVWEEHFVDTLAQVDAIRLQLLLDRSREVKMSAADANVRSILEAIRQMVRYCLGQLHLMEIVLASRDESLYQNKLNRLDRSLHLALGIGESQFARIANVYEIQKAQLKKTVLELQIVARALSFIWRSFMQNRLRCDAERFNELLTTKQVKKVLHKVAKWRGALGDRMDEVLRNMGNLSIE